MKHDFDLISKSSLQQSQIGKFLKSSKPPKSKLSPAIIKDSNKLNLFNEIYLFGLSKEKEFKTIDCLWEYTNPSWKKSSQVTQKVNLF
jgi:hypothetical protein